MGAEYRRKGVNVILGPVVGPAWRVVKGGRNWEGFSVDPYLSGALVGKSTTGIQEQRVITSTKVSSFPHHTIQHTDFKKHYIANEQETIRTPDEYRMAISSNIDDKTMHEVYLW